MAAQLDVKNAHSVLRDFHHIPGSEGHDAPSSFLVVTMHVYLSWLRDRQSRRGCSERGYGREPPRSIQATLESRLYSSAGWLGVMLSRGDADGVAAFSTTYIRNATLDACATFEDRALGVPEWVGSRSQRCRGDQIICAQLGVFNFQHA